MTDIKPDYKKTTVEQYILPPGTKIAITGKNAPLYIPDTKTADKFNEILKYDDIKSFNKFVAEQQAQLKKDIGTYNLLLTKEAKTQEDVNQINVLVQKINTGDVGTLEDVTLKATREAGRKGLGYAYGGLTEAYQAEKAILSFQLVGAAASPLISGSKVATSIVGGINKVSKPFLVPSFIGSGALTGVSAYTRTGNLGYALSSGAGSFGGLVGGLYSKQMVEGAGRGLRATGRGLKFVGERLGQSELEPFKARMNKRGSAQLFSQEEDIYIRNAEGKIIGIKKSAQRRVFEEYVNRGREYKTFKDGKEVTVKVFPSKQEKFDRLRELLNKLDRTDKKKIGDFIRLTRDTIGDDAARDFFTQEGIMKPIVRTPEKPGALKYFDSSFEKPVKVTRTITGTDFSRPQSAYYGRGLYERTDFPLPRTRGRVTGSSSVMSSNGIFRGSLTGGGLFSRESLGVGSALSLGGRFGEANITRTRTSLSSSEKNKEETQQGTGLFFGTPTAESLRQPQESIQLSSPALKQPQAQEEEQITNPTLTPPLELYSLNLLPYKIDEIKQTI